MMSRFDFEEDEEKLLEMVNDFIESSSSSSSSSSTTNNACSSATHAHFGHSPHHFTLQEIMRHKTEEERKINERVVKHMRNMKNNNTTNISEVKKWLVKCLKMDGFQASLCHTSWATTPGCVCGNYEYIEIVEEDVPKRTSNRLIVDIDFKSQFEVARPTKNYIELSNKLPFIFVGREDKLKKIISLLCSAAEESLRSRGLHIPPWRKPSYMNSKYWKFSNDNCSNCHDKLDKNHNKIPKNDKFGKWEPQAHVMIKGWGRDLGGDSSLNNQFAHKRINCC